MVFALAAKYVGDFDLDLRHEALFEDRWLFLCFWVDWDQYGESMLIVGFVRGREHIGAMFEPNNPYDMKPNGDECIHSRFYFPQAFHYPLIILIAIDL